MTVPVLVLAGPAGAGKSTAGALTAARLAVPFVDLDEVAGPYYAEVGWSVDRLVSRIAQVGRVAAEREWEPARAHAVRRAVTEHPGSVLALGAGHGSYTDPTCRDAVQQALAPVRHVVLLLPWADRSRSLAELRSRWAATRSGPGGQEPGTTGVHDGHDLLAEWLEDAGTRALATRVICTEGEPPAATAARLAALVPGAAGR